MTCLTAYDLAELRVEWNNFGGTEDFLKILQQKDPVGLGRGDMRKLVVVGAYKNAPRREVCLGSLHFITSDVVFFEPSDSIQHYRQFFGVVIMDPETSPPIYRLQSFAPNHACVGTLFEPRVSCRAYPYEVSFREGHGNCYTTSTFFISHSRWRPLSRSLEASFTS